MIWATKIGWQKMRWMGWSPQAYISKGPGRMVLRVPLPYIVRTEVLKAKVEDKTLIVKWTWWQPEGENPLVEAERPPKSEERLA